MKYCAAIEFLPVWNFWYSVSHVERIFFCCGAATQRGSWPPPRSWGFLNHIRPITVGRTPLDKWSARRRDLYLTTHNTRNRQTFTAPAGFESATPASQRPKTHILDGAATGIGNLYIVECRIPYTQLWYVTRQPWYPNKGSCQQHSSLCCCFVWEPTVNTQTQSSKSRHVSNLANPYPCSHWDLRYRRD
jgi:hypothetical protein